MSMLNEPHYPSTFTATVVFIVLALMMVGVFAWAFFINFGSLELRADQTFQVSANGKIFDCPEKICTITLSPKSYSFLVQSKGYYDQSFDIAIERWKKFEKTIFFELIPYLRPLNKEETIAIPVSTVRLRKENEKGKVKLIRQNENSQTIIASFETLQNPTLQTREDKALIVDNGRAFFITLSDGKKLRRFDDTIFVQHALMSDHAKKILFFIRTNNQDQIVIWNNETNELNPIPWYEPPERIQWDLNKDHRIFVISNKLSEDASLLKRVKETLPNASSSLRLFRYNLDTEKAQKVLEFDKKIPLALSRIGDRYVIDYEGGEREEIVVQ